jgi:2'-5' RNA ligase
METAVLVRVPEAEPACGAHRRKYTPSGAEGMPAHVTVLVPFAESSLLVGMVRELRETLAEVSPFRYTISRLDRFPGPPNVLYGVPEPAAPFVRLSELLRDRFGLLPYGGQYSTLIPHLTIATRLPEDDFDRIEAEVEPWLPVEASASACEVWEHADTGWRMLHVVPL